MTVTLPPLVQTRQANWQAKRSVTVEARSELADWVWESWDKGYTAIPLSSPMYEQSLALKTDKDAVFPSDDFKRREEFEEVLDEVGKPLTGELQALGMDKLVTAEKFERLQHALGMPIIPFEDYIRAAVMKLEGRVATNKLNPNATSKQIKAALKPYEEASARKAFNMEV